MMMMGRRKHECKRETGTGESGGREWGREKDWGYKNDQSTYKHTHTHIYICTCVYIHSCRGGIMKPTKYYLGKGMERGGLWEYYELVQSTLYSCIELSQ
jgi:hypothetical protein